eukprot:TRINITY_DN6924_c7_g1_i1.p1 TRINITY_DN6924_c7_g1~~TRINITY_DN6924_c7_g1_i1.p1  ORF type:complete len:628 (-),score=141.94 TRINITY_DN6924_c7_g1_i1:41-1924(-)
MGNAGGSARKSGKPLRTLELRITPPKVELPPGPSGLPVVLVGKISLVDLDGPSADASNDVPVAGPIGEGCAIPWGEALSIQLPSDTSSVLALTLFGVELPRGVAGPSGTQEEAGPRVLTEVLLPTYAGEGGLAQMGVTPNSSPLMLCIALLQYVERQRDLQPSVVAAQFRRLQEALRPDKASLALTLQEVAPQPVVSETTPRQAAAFTAESAREPENGRGSIVPPARRQVIALELQNAALLAQLDNGQAQLSPALGSAPSHVKQLQGLQQENAELRQHRDALQCKLEGNSAPVASGEDVQRARQRLQTIRASYEERMRVVQDQLAQVSAAAAAAAGDMDDGEAMRMQMRLKEGITRRDALLQQWREVSAAGRSVPESSHPEVRRLTEQVERNREVLSSLQSELAKLNEREESLMRQQQLRGGIQQLRDELEELARAREDERVRAESEARELRAERDGARDRLADATAELQRLRAKAEAMRALNQEEDESEEKDGADSLETLRQEHELLLGELSQLREREASRQQTIRELEEEQEALVLKATGLATQGAEMAVPGSQSFNLEAKVAELRAALADSQRRTVEHQEATDQLRAQIGAATLHLEELRHNYEAAQQALDEHIMNPELNGRPD